MKLVPFHLCYHILHENLYLPPCLLTISISNDIEDISILVTGTTSDDNTKSFYFSLINVLHSKVKQNYKNMQINCNVLCLHPVNFFIKMLIFRDIYSIEKHLINLKNMEILSALYQQWGFFMMGIYL